MKGVCLYIAAASYVLGFYAGPALADPVKDAHTKVELITDTDGIKSGRPFWVGLRMDMDEKWQVYWKNPGDSGLPTVIQWELPEGFNAGEVHWPFPIRMDYPEVTSYGYEGQVVLLTELIPPGDLPAEGVKEIKAHVTWLACGNICVPGKAGLSLTLPVLAKEPALDAEVQKVFQETKKDWPLAKSDWKVRAYHEGEYFRLHLIAPQRKVSTLTQTTFFPDANDVIDHGYNQTFRKTANGYDLILRKSNVTQKEVSRLKGVLVSPEGWQEGKRALAIDVPFNLTEEQEL